MYTSSKDGLHFVHYLIIDEDICNISFHNEKLSLFFVIITKFVTLIFVTVVIFFSINLTCLSIVVWLCFNTSDIMFHNLTQCGVSQGALLTPKPPGTITHDQQCPWQPRSKVVRV